MGLVTWQTFAASGRRDALHFGIRYTETFPSYLQQLYRLKRNLMGIKHSASTTKFMLFGPIGHKNGRPSLWLADTFTVSLLQLFNDFCTHLTENKSSSSPTKFVFCADPSTQMAAVTSDWRKHFWLLSNCWTCWKDFDETLQEASAQCPLSILCLSSRSVNKDGRPGLWFAEAFSTPPLLTLNGFDKIWQLQCNKHLNILY